MSHRYIAEIVYTASFPWIDFELIVYASADCRDIANSSRTEMLVALCCAIAGAVWHTDQSDVSAAWICVMVTSKQGGDTVPVDSIH